MSAFCSAAVRRFLFLALALVLVAAFTMGNLRMPWSAQARGDAAIPAQLALVKSASLRVMVIGDSITAGVGDATQRGGYRGPLERLLSGAGYHVAFVGGRSDFARRLADPYHEGWPGYVIRTLAPGAPGELLGPVTRSALVRYRPDVVLLMAGTNDFLRDRRLPDFGDATVLAGMSDLLAQIFATAPHVRVIVAGIVDSPAIPQRLVARYDRGAASLPALVQSFARRGFAIAYAPGMYAAVPRDRAHFPDGLHPFGEGGYAAIAQVWFRAIASLTAPAVTAGSGPSS